MALFNIAQSFYIDSSAVANSTQVSISGIGVYFMYRPNPYDNRSTVQTPGITMFLTDVSQDVPDVTNTALFTNLARCEWNQISSSSDASAETLFTFNSPIVVSTDKTYAFIISYDNNEDFVPWLNVTGNDLVGTTNASTGPSNQIGGNYYEFISAIQTVTDLTNVSDYASLWNDVNNTTLKFNIYAARYAISGDPIIANTTLNPNTVVYNSNLFFEYNSTTNDILIFQPSPRIENISFNLTNSLKQAVVGAQRVFQNNVFWPGGNLYGVASCNMSNTITAGTLSNGASFNWNTVFGSYSGEEYIVLFDSSGVNIREVISISTSGSTLTVDEPVTFVNTAAKFMISPVATVDSFNTSYINGQLTALMFLRDSNANSTCRFTGFSVDPTKTVIASGGTGYSNTDIFYVTNYEYIPGKVIGNYAAVANVSTNTSGGITSLSFSNIGSGLCFSNVNQVFCSSVLTNPNNASTNTSSGSGANVSVAVGSILITEQSNNVFANCQVLNIDPSDIIVMSNPDISNTSIPPNTSVFSILTTTYYANVDTSTSTGYGYYVGPQQLDLTYGTRIALNQMPNIPVIMSRSNEFSTLYPNGNPNDQANSLSTYSNNFLISITTQSNNDWVSMGTVYGPTVEFGRYIVNNDYSNENTNSGNSLARYLTTVINLAGINNAISMAEDIRVYLTAYRPQYTDFQVFARIQNSGDSEPFDDEDWTRLQLIDGDIHSSSGYVDMTWGFQDQPNTAYTVANATLGYISTANNSAVITSTSNSTMFTSNVVANNIIKIYDPLFPNNNFAVCMVNTVSNSTSLIVDQLFSSNTIYGIGGYELTRSGLAMDVLAFPFQAFNNIQNENVVRYYNQSYHTYDNYNILQIKVCLLSSNPRDIPRINNIRAIALSS